MSGLKPFHFEPILSPGMRMDRFITVEMDKIPLDGNSSFRSFDIASSRHALSMKDRSSSISFNVVIELSIVNYLDF